MEIFNRIPTISEDTLQYNLYPPPSLSDKASVTTYAACIRAYIDTLLPDFIWHRDAFEVKVIANPDLAGDGWIMEGRMRVGDCVDDEWCAVWLLKEISTKWDLVICVFDTDGEFLLIEAAEVLPPWVQPNNTENRVWIYSSHLHLIPLTHISPPSSKQHHRTLPGAQDGERAFDDQSEESLYFLSAEDAIKLVRDSSCDTVSPLEVENCVWQRISRYPAATRHHMHITKAYIPSDIARSLLKYPLLVQKAVETFYTRDAVQLRSAHRMSRFPPDSSVLRSVKMTRTAYAQLVGQKFFPPKVFGNWDENENTDERRWRDVGMKIAVGFEILYQENKGRAETLNPVTGVMNSTVESRKDAARCDPEYAKYIENLVSVGYFQGEVKGSALWNVLENKAVDTFIDVRGDENVKRMSFASQINAATSEYTLLPASMAQEEDSTDWLNVDVDEFEATLERTMGQRRPDEMDIEQSKNDFEERLATEQASKLKDLATKVEDFVGGEGDLEGARFADEEFSDGSMSDDGLDSDSENEDDRATTAARQTAMDNLVPSLEPSEYGKMPASYHGNSQRVAPTTIDSEDVGGKLGPRDISEADLKSPLKAKPVRKPLIPRDHYDGVDSDDETDEEDMERDDDEDEDRPQVVGDVEIDMEEEEEEFLEFSRQALGISESQWNDIVQDRQQRGAFVPSSAVTRIPTGGSMPAQQKGDNPVDTRKVRTPAPGPRPNVNPNLDSFEAVMRAMDAELARVKSSTKNFTPAQNPPPAIGKGKQKATVEDEEDDTELDMDAELRAALATDDGPEDEIDEPMDYKLIKNFLESYKSQAGLSGPVGNLAGRLQPGWKIPRDIS